MFKILQFLSKKFFNMSLRWSYFKSREKDPVFKEHKGDMDAVRLQYFAKNLNSKWTYVSDRLWGLINRVTPQPKATGYKSGDCDDYAAAVAGMYKDVNKTYLYTYFPARKIQTAHTVPVIKLKNGEFLVIDWGRSYIFKNTRLIREHFERKCNCRMLSVHWAQWNNKKGKYKLVKPPKDGVSEQTKSGSKPEKSTHIKDF